MERLDGYLPIRDYAGVGDGRAAALVGRDGAIDWYALPTTASAPVFAALLDPERGGSFTLKPDEPFEVTHHYLAHTNVVARTFTTASGKVRVTDAITRTEDGELAWFELARRIEGLSGQVTVCYKVDPRFPLSDDRPERTEHGWRCGSMNLQLLEFDAAGGSCIVREGERALLALVVTIHEPLPIPTRDEIEHRIDTTAAVDRRWANEHEYDGDWADMVERSLLAIKLLTYDPDGGIVAAVTTSLPERLGGDMNWDYRFAWVRDSCYTLDALMAAGRREVAHEAFGWLLRKIAETAPEIRPLYALEFGPDIPEREVDLAGYRGSRPVRVGNAAWAQTQLGVYGDLLDTAYRYVDGGNALDEQTQELLVGVLSWLAKRWRSEDSSFWEIRGETRHYTHSKLSSYVAFDRALRLARLGQLPNDDAPEWVRQRDEIGAFVNARCWSPEHGAYRFYADEDKFDTTTLLGYRCNPERPSQQLRDTIDVVRRELTAGGPLLWRNSDAIGKEGAFVACSFWLADALAHVGRFDEAAEVMDETCKLASDVGLFSEMIDPATGEFLGNFPQGLSHLALVQAAYAISSPRS